MRVIVALACLLLFIGCEGAKPDPPDVRRASVEDEVAQSDSNAKRAEIIITAREYLARAFPDWKINGVSTYHPGENYYFVFGDISKGDERRTVSVIVRLFVEDNEHAYWKAEHSPDDSEQKTLGYVIRPYQQ